MLSALLLPLLALAMPSTIHVPADQPTIQDAIVAAANGDTVLVDPGTWVEQIDLLGKAITVKSVAGPLATTIDSQGMEVWPDSPYAPVVRMVNGEGPGTRLEGFTITGANVSFPDNTAGVFGPGTSPVIKNCRVANIVGGPGIWADGSVEDCVVTGNDSLPYTDGGGITGAPDVLRTVVANNRSGGKGGGIYLTGPALVRDCCIQGNVSGNGIDGYSGGGIYGPATIEGCLITGNSAYHYFSGGPPDSIGSGVDGAVSIDRSTLFGNFVVNSGGLVSKPGGGVHNVGVITSSILWDNLDDELSATASPTILYSIVRGGYPGTGNQDLEPLFVDAAGGDFFLQLGSPAIDAGDPSAPLDPDGTRADAGAVYFPQFPAALAVRNGAGVNPVCYTSPSNPAFDSTWTATVDTTVHGFPVLLSKILFFAKPISGIFLSFGELLGDPTTRIGVTLNATPVSGVATHTLNLPPAYSLGGITVTTQAIEIGAADLSLGNALDLTLGL